MQTHRGKFAVMRHGSVVEFMDTAGDAYKFAVHMWRDEMWSCNEVREPVCFGRLAALRPTDSREAADGLDHIGI
jgi:hypothetical protein